MFVYQTYKIFACIDIREFAKRRVKPNDISLSIFINIFTYFIIHIYTIISSIVSYIIAPIFCDVYWLLNT